MRELKATLPAAIVIDLSRLPSQGCDLALLVCSQQATCRIPLVFAGGEVEKVARVQETLPDAVYTPMFIPDSVFSGLGAKKAASPAQATGGAARTRMGAATPPRAGAAKGRVRLK